MLTVKEDGKLKETAWREYQARKKWQQTWGKDYEELAKWRDQIKIPAVERRHIEKGNIRTSYNPWLNPIEIEVKPTNRVPRTSSEEVGLRAQFPLEYPIDMYISPKHFIDPPDLPSKPETVIFIG